MIKALLKKPAFLFGIVTILALLIASFLYELYRGDTVYDNQLIYDESGKITASAPLSPIENPPLGTDRFGMPLHWKVIQGAKYTIISAVTISLLQVVISSMLAIFYQRYGRRIHYLIEGLVESSLYVPITIVAYITLFPLQTFIDPASQSIQFIIVQVSILVLIGIPPLVLLFSKDLKQVMKEEYILASQTIGAQGYYLFRKHILPYMMPRLILQFSHQTVQVLILLAHLGFLSLFLGGYQMREVFHEEFKPFSLSNEWAGEIGRGYIDIRVTPWIIGAPLAAFTLTVISFNLITNAIQEVLGKNYIKVRKKNKKSIEIENSCNDRQMFELVNKKERF